MRLPRSSNPILLTLAVLAGCPLASAQVPHSTGIENDLPSMQAKAAATLPSLVLRSVAEIALPGPLAGDGPRVQADRVAVRVAQGAALVVPAAGQAVELVPDPGPTPAAAWAEAPGGRFRYRSGPGQWIVSEKRCRRCADGWTRHWKLRVGGNTVVPPLALAGRACFGTLEDRVYCVKDRSGHRLWVAEVSGRVSNALVAWSGTVEAEVPTGDAHPPLAIEAILVVPDGGSDLVVLAASSGQKLAGLQLTTAGERMVGPPAVMADGRIVVARQGYRPSDASLAVYQLFAAPPAPAKPPPGAALPPPP